MSARIDAKPFLDRQLPEAGPLLFWRPGPDETRDGMLWLVGACTNPVCSCRDAHVEIFNTDDRLLSAEEADGELKRSNRNIEGRAPLKERRARLYIDVDDGRVEADKKRENDDDLVKWAAEQIDARLLELLKQRFVDAKERGLKKLVLSFDAGTWRPGHLLAYSLVHPSGGVEIDLDGVHYIVDDQHCVEPGCDCEDVMLDFHGIDEASRQARLVGSVWIAFETSRPLEFDPATPEDLPRLRALLDVYRRGDPDFRQLGLRRIRMRALAPEIHRRAQRKPLRRSATKPRPNGPCPCGSGRKYKKCCLNKTA